MYVHPQETKHAFFSQEVQTPWKSLASNGCSMEQPICFPDKPMAKPKPNHEPKKQKLRKTRRGKGKSKSKGENKSSIKFSILGSNANGLKAKLDSLKNVIGILNNPDA